MSIARQPELDASSPVGVSALLRSFTGQFGSAEGALVVRAPGRVNLLGDHTDYNDGLVLPMTIDRSVYVAVRARGDDLVRIWSSNYDEALENRLDDGALSGSRSSGAWATYVRGTIEELRARGLVGGGFDMLIHGDVPIGAGLSSSAALEVAVAYGLQSLYRFELEGADFVRLCQLVEHRYAGVQCGIMDQFASRFGRRDHALYLDCRSLAREHVPLPLSAAGLVVVIVDSGARRELATSKYGERRAECQQAVEALRRVEPSISSLRDVSPAMLRKGVEGLDALHLARARHVVEENARVESARQALAAADFETFGRLMWASHESLKEQFEVSCPELDALVDIAGLTDGVIGARMTGGGFGGCTVNLVRREAVDRLCEAIRQEYEPASGEARVLVLERNDETETIGGP